MGLVWDAIFMAGLGLVIYGVYLLSLPAAIILAGVLMAVVALGLK